MLYDLDMIRFMVCDGCYKGGGGTLIVQEGGVFKSAPTKMMKLHSQGVLGSAHKTYSCCFRCQKSHLVKEA